MDIDEAFRVYFQSPDGTVLVTCDAWNTADEAVEHAEEILQRPGDYELLDPDGKLVSAEDIDEGESYTVEAVDPDDID